MINKIDKFELSDTLDCIVMKLLDTQNKVEEAKEFINSVIALEKKNQEKFLRINNEMIEILRLERRARAKMRVLKPCQLMLR